MKNGSGIAALVFTCIRSFFADMHQQQFDHFEYIQQAHIL